MSEQLTFEGFDLASGFNCDSCKDRGWRKSEFVGEGYHACPDCELGNSICCEECEIELVPFHNNFVHCACCGEEYEVTDAELFIINEIEESWNDV